jgi:hypothetical protein
MDFEVYCDESRQELFRAQIAGDNYVLIGGLWTKAAERPAHKRAIRNLRLRHNVAGEFKWNRVSPSRLAFYTDLVRLFFSTDMRFRVLVLRADELDSVRFHEADNELMFYKFYYQLLHHWILDFNTYRVFVDTKTNRVRDRLRTLQTCLSNANLSAVVEVQALPSHQVDLIQFVDVLMGAVGYKFHRRASSRAKTAVMEGIEKHLQSEIAPTPRAEDKFNVFRFRPGGGW